MKEGGLKATARATTGTMNRSAWLVCWAIQLISYSGEVGFGDDSGGGYGPCEMFRAAGTWKEDDLE